MMNFPLVYLASQSPRRQQLLQQISVPFEVLLPHDTVAAEALEKVLPGETPLNYVQRVTKLKLQMAKLEMKRLALPEHPILCADTTVAWGTKILGKPQDASQAHEMLRLLSGQKHQVLTAIAVAHGRKTFRAVSRSKVQFDELSESDIAAYVASQEPMGKAGAYGIQGLASGFIRSIQGSYSGIMGLPLYETCKILRQISES
jgi:septum formation protein